MPSCSTDHETVRWDGTDPCWCCGAPVDPPAPPPILDDDDAELYAYGYGVWG